MKIAILVSNASVTGVGLYNTLICKAFNRNNIPTDVFVFSTTEALNDFCFYKDTNTGYNVAAFNDATYSTLNSYDYVMLCAMPHISEPDDYREAFFDMVINKITTKKIYIPHERQIRAFKRAYDERIFTSEFLNTFHRIVTFDLNAEVFSAFREVVGDSINDKFVPLELPYEFNTEHWKPVSDKDKRITYFGRVNRLKYPGRIIEIVPDLHKAGWQAEMRGITRNIGVVAVKNLVYHWDDETNKMTKEPSRRVIWFDKKYKEAHNIDKKVKYLERYSNDTGKVLVFPAYNYIEGIEALSYQAFGCDFFRLKNDIYGYVSEYAIFDMITAGVIPVLDYDFATHAPIRENGVDTGQTIYDKSAGIFLKSDLSNVDEVITEMTYLYNNPDEYEKKRKHCLNVFMNHANMDNIVKNLVNSFN